MHLYATLFALLLTLVAFGLYVALAMHRLAANPRDERHYTMAIAWLWFALAVVVGVTTMRSAASPAEYGAIKAAYVTALVLLLVNAIVQMDEVGGRMDAALRKGAMWSSGLLAVLLGAAASMRIAAWERSSAALVIVRGDYRATPGRDRVGVAEDILMRRGLRNRTMKRMLRTLEKSARRSRARTQRSKDE